MGSSLLRALCVVLALGGPASAQDLFSPVIVVNDRAITGYEIEQRIRLLEAFGVSCSLDVTRAADLR